MRNGKDRDCKKIKREYANDTIQNQVCHRVMMTGVTVSGDYAFAETCRKGVGCRVAVCPRRLNTSSIKRFGPTYSMFILSADFIGTGKVKLFLWCQRLLMQSSTSAVIPVATITLKKVSACLIGCCFTSLSLTPQHRSTH